jgi:hypothetical protein
MIFASSVLHVGRRNCGGPAGEQRERERSIWWGGRSGNAANAPAAPHDTTTGAGSVTAPAKDDRQVAGSNRERVPWSVTRRLAASILEAVSAEMGFASDAADGSIAAFVRK